MATCGGRRTGRRCGRWAASGYGAGWLLLVVVHAWLGKALEERGYRADGGPNLAPLRHWSEVRERERDRKGSGAEWGRFWGREECVFERLTHLPVRSKPAQHQVYPPLPLPPRILEPCRIPSTLAIDSESSAIPAIPSITPCHPWTSLGETRSA
jgi:hypothetical protein